MSNQPLVSYSVGGLSVSLWENTYENDDGSQRSSKSVSLRRTYFSRKDKEFVEQKITMNPAELGCLRAMLKRMETAVMDERGEAPF